MKDGLIEASVAERRSCLQSAQEPKCAGVPIGGGPDELFGSGLNFLLADVEQCRDALVPHFREAGLSLSWRRSLTSGFGAEETLQRG